MKHPVISYCLALLVLFAAPSRANIVTDHLIESQSGNNLLSGASSTYGGSFTVGSVDITVTSLGVYDESDNGLASSHDVGIWDSTGTLLAKVTVPAGTEAPLEGDYRYADLPSPITLSANEVYTIGAYFAASSDLGLYLAKPRTTPSGTTPGGSATFGSAIASTSDMIYYAGTTSELSIPSTPYGTTLLMANFKYYSNATSTPTPEPIAAPEPTTDGKPSMQIGGRAKKDGETVTRNRAAVISGICNNVDIVYWKFAGDSSYRKTVTGSTGKWRAKIGPLKMGNNFIRVYGVNRSTGKKSAVHNGNIVRH